MSFNPSTIRPRPRTRPKDAEPLACATSSEAAPVTDGMLDPRVLIRVPHLRLEAQNAAPIFAVTVHQSAAATEHSSRADMPTVVVNVAVDDAPVVNPFPKGILNFSLAEENSASSGLGLAGLWSRVTAVVPAKYVGITTGGLVVILMVIGLSRHRHQRSQSAGETEAPAWQGAVSMPGAQPPGGAAAYPMSTATTVPQAAPSTAPAWSAAAQPQIAQSAGPLMSAAHPTVVCTGSTPSDVVFNTQANRQSNSQIPASPMTTAWAPPKSDLPSYGVAQQQNAGAMYGPAQQTSAAPYGPAQQASAVPYGPAQADSVPSMSNHSPAWGGLPPRDGQMSAQASSQPASQPATQGPPPDGGYRTAQRYDPSTIPATRGPGEYGEPGVARLQGTIDGPR